MTSSSWQRTLWLMVTVQALMSFAFSASGPFLPLFIIQLGVKPIAAVSVWSGVVASANFLMAAIFSPMWGGLADRTGRKAMVVRSCVAVAVFTALMGFVGNVWELFAARASMGIFSGFSAAAIAMVATQVPEERLGFSLGWMATGQLVGGLLGPLFGGFLADSLHNYRQVFFATSAFALAAALVCMLFVREHFRPEYSRESRPSFLATLREIALHPQLAPMFAVVLLAQVVAFGVQPIVPLFVRALAGNVPWLATAAGVAFAVTGLADLIASPFLGKRSDRIGYRRVLLVSLCGVAAFTIPQAFAHTVGAFIALRFGVGLFLGGVLPTANALIGRLFPLERRGQVFGITSSATFLGMFAGPLLAGTIAARFGFEAAFLAIGATALANFAWVSVSVRRSPAGAPLR
ncbi:MAG TPA: MFS transporter [Candidatus Dormibacteraeota bacterium]|nr:MFS transporter [Candidatus Dormibacteraeota bacterium]